MPITLVKRPSDTKPTIDLILVVTAALTNLLCICCVSNYNSFININAKSLPYAINGYSVMNYNNYDVYLSTSASLQLLLQALCTCICAIDPKVKFEMFSILTNKFNIIIINIVY